MMKSYKQQKVVFVPTKLVMDLRVLLLLLLLLLLLAICVAFDSWRYVMRSHEIHITPWDTHEICREA
jgi:hypothetical protein